MWLKHEVAILLKSGGNNGILGGIDKVNIHCLVKKVMQLPSKQKFISGLFTIINNEGTYCIHMSSYVQG